MRQHQKPLAEAENPFLSCSKYLARHSIESAGRLNGSQTGSPTKYLFAIKKFCNGVEKFIRN